MKADPAGPVSLDLEGTAVHFENAAAAVQIAGPLRRIISQRQLRVLDVDHEPVVAGCATARFNPDVALTRATAVAPRVFQNRGDDLLHLPAVDVHEGQAR